MRLCDGLAGNGANITMIHPYTYMKENISRNDIYKSYGVTRRFTVRMLYTPLFEYSGKYFVFGALVTAFTITTLRIIAVNIGRLNNVIILSRDNKVVLPVLILKKIFGRLFRVRIVLIVPEVRPGKLYSWAVKNVDGLCANVSSASNLLIMKYKMKPENIFLLLAPVPDYKNDISKAEARKVIGYNSSTPLIVYTGKVGLGIQELFYILDAAEILRDYHFMFTGGRQSAVEYFRKLCSERKLYNITFTGFFDDSTFVRNYQLAADVLISYYTHADHTIEHSYPQKISEYMSTFNPVVTPDFAATRDVVNETNAIFVEPENPVSLAQGINKAVEDKERSAKIAKQAYQDIQQLTFEKVTKRVLQFLETLN